MGANIRAARDERGLKQSDLAALLPGKVESPSVSRWERGLVTPGLKSLIALGEVLGHDVSWFFADHSDTAERVVA